jgi:hypothetical protein
MIDERDQEVLDRVEEGAQEGTEVIPTGTVERVQVSKCVGLACFICSSSLRNSPTGANSDCRQLPRRGGEGWHLPQLCISGRN